MFIGVGEMGVGEKGVGEQVPIPCNTYVEIIEPEMSPNSWPWDNTWSLVLQARPSQPQVSVCTWNALNAEVTKMKPLIK